MSRRIFVDTSVLLRYFLGDDPARGFAAATLVDGEDRLVVSTGVILEAIHVMRTRHGVPNPPLASMLVGFLSRENVELSDADQPLVIAALRWSQRAPARRIPDAILAAAAERARCDAIATFDEAFASPSVPVRLL